MNAIGSHAPLTVATCWQLHFSPRRGEPAIAVAVDVVRFRVGRRDGLNLTLLSHQVSGLHAEFVTVGHRLFVRDLGSTNGTYVNGRRIDHLDHPLRHGDHVRLADRVLIVSRSRTSNRAAETADPGDTAFSGRLTDPPPHRSASAGE